MQQNLVEERMAVIAGAPFVNAQMKVGNREVEINSRFGPVMVQPAKAVTFPNGMPGLPNKVSFCLIDFPSVKNPQFKLLQSLDDHGLSFIVVPSTFDNQLLDLSDVYDVCTSLSINPDNLLILFIVTAHETPNGRRLSVNAKAPVFIDAVSKVATQYVFQNNTYEIQHFIS